MWGNMACWGRSIVLDLLQITLYLNEGFNLCGVTWPVGVGQ